MTAKMNMSAGSSGFLGYGTPEVELFRKDLKKKYNSTLAAWRNVFDPQLSNALSFGKFNTALEEHVHYTGNVKKLWDDLTLGGQKAHASFKDIDSDMQRLVDSTREKLIDKMGSLLHAWYFGISPDGVLVAEPEFVANCNAMDNIFKNPKRVFRMLLCREGQRSISLEDLETLLVGVPAIERAVLWAGRSQEELDSTELSTGKPLAPLSNKEAVKSMMEQWEGQKRGMVSVNEFRNMLIQRYGSVFSAWKKLLDTDQNGIMTLPDWTQSCQKLGLKSIKTLWHELDKEGKGHVYLKDICQETGEAFAQFEKRVLSKYGDTKTAWRKGFDPKNTLRCDLEPFVKLCEGVGYAGDASRLYKLVRPESGRAFLNFEDLWPDLDKNQFAHVSQARLHQSPVK
jgi:hypothetical protein